MIKKGKKMNKLMFLMGLVFIIGCETNYKSGLATDREGFVEINGKKCQVVTINTGSGGRTLYYVDCYKGSSITYKEGKHTEVTVTTSKPRHSNDTTECPTTPPE